MKTTELPIDKAVCLLIVVLAKLQPRWRHVPSVQCNLWLPCRQWPWCYWLTWDQSI